MEQEEMILTGLSNQTELAILAALLENNRLLQEILLAVLGISFGDDVIAQAAERYTRKMNTARGGAF